MRIKAKSSNQFSQIASASSTSVIKFIQLRLSVRWGSEVNISFVPLVCKTVSANYSVMAFRVLGLGDNQGRQPLGFKIYIDLISQGQKRSSWGIL